MLLLSRVYHSIIYLLCTQRTTPGHKLTSVLQYCEKLCFHYIRCIYLSARSSAFASRLASQWPWPSRRPHLDHHLSSPFFLATLSSPPFFLAPISSMQAPSTTSTRVSRLRSAVPSTTSTRVARPSGEDKVHSSEARVQKRQSLSLSTTGSSVASSDVCRAPSTVSTRIARRSGMKGEPNPSVALKRVSRPKDIMETSQSSSASSMMSMNSHRSPNATPVPSSINKRLSTSIPKKSKEAPRTPNKNSTIREDAAGSPEVRTPVKFPQDTEDTIRVRVNSTPVATPMRAKLDVGILPKTPSPSPRRTMSTAAASPLTLSQLASPTPPSKSPSMSKVSAQRLDPPAVSKGTPTKGTRKPSQTSTVTPSKISPQRPPLRQIMPPTIESPNNSFELSATFHEHDSVWDDGDMSFDLVTEDDGGPIDEEVSSVLLSPKCFPHLESLW